jgi:hypothetical protein
MRAIGRKIGLPDAARLNQQRQLMWRFDEMIANVERDLGTIMYSRDGRLWLIHHTRAFRKNTSLKHPRASLVAIGKSSIA